MTSNGSENCGDVEIVERNLSNLLDAMYDVDTSRSVVDILGAGFSGDTPMACCMSQDGKNKTVNALNNLKDNMPYDANSQNLRYALEGVGEALENISNCK